MSNNQPGGTVKGPSHAEGGVDFEVNGETWELEGGEIIIDKKHARDPNHYFFTGTTAEIASEINDLFGAKTAEEKARILQGGDYVICKACSQDDEVHDYSGTLAEIVKQMNECSVKYEQKNTALSQNRILKDGGEVTPKEAAEKFIQSLPKGEIEKIAAAMRARIDEMIREEQEELFRLEAQVKEIHAKIQASLDSEDRNKELAKRLDLRKEEANLEPLIRKQENIIKVLKNHGDLISFTDKRGTRHERIPDFTKVDTRTIIFDEENILTEPVPGYIPLINETKFRHMGFVFDCIRMDKDQYLLATEGYKEDIYYHAEEDEPKADHGLIMVTLDQLVLINDYYYTKAKAINQKSADDNTKRQEEYWDKLPEERRKKYYEQDAKALYNALPAKDKKKVTFEQWEKMTWQEKEQVHKFHKRYGAKRLVSKLEDDRMYVSFHEMYERFVDATALPKNTKTGQPEPAGPRRPQGYQMTAHIDVSMYWDWFKEFMKWKMKDIRVQREFESDIRKAAIETSFGESNTDSTLKEKYGILVKRQSGDKINPVEIEQIRNAWVKINKLFGGLKKVAEEKNLKISHTASTYIFASKAIGIFIPDMQTIAVSAKYGDEQFENTFAHETAHWIDSLLGGQDGKRWITDDFESTAGKIVSLFRRNQNRASDSDYLNSSKECFARAMQQYYAITNFGDNAQLMFVDKPLSELTYFFEEDKYVSKDVYYSKLKPLIEQFISENKDLFKYGVEADDVVNEIEKIELSDENMENKEIEQIESNKQAVSAPNEITSLIDLHARLQQAEDGKLSYNDFMDFYEWVKSNKETITGWINEYSIAKLKTVVLVNSGDKKQQIVERLYSKYLDAFNLSGVLSYSPFSEKFEVALDKKIKSQTEAQYLQHFKDEEKKVQAQEKAMTNPETYEELRDFVGKNGIDKLNDEQLLKYDRFVAERTIEVEKKAEERKQVITGVKLGDIDFKYAETTHSKKGTALYVVSLTGRVEKEVYSDLNAKAKKLGGYYSSYNKDGAIPGFQFGSKEGAEKFMELKAGAVNTADIHAQREKEREENRIETLKEKGENLQGAGSESLSRDRKSNTARRARMAASAEEEAQRKIKFGKVMERIAEGIQDGSIKYLKRVANITDIELFARLLSMARRDRITKEKIPYREEGSVATDEKVIRYVRYPYPYFYVQNLRRALHQVEEIPGRKREATAMLKGIKNRADDSYVYFKDEYYIKPLWIVTEPEGSYTKWDAAYFKDSVDRFNRAQRMGLVNPSLLRMALREYLQLNSGSFLSKEQESEQKVRELERKFVGTNIPGFFPTPVDLASEMVQLADIQPGNTILEPSAGLGHIAEIIKSEHPDNELTLVEYHSGLADALKEKGFNVIHGDFLQIKGVKYDRIIMNPPFENLQDIDHVMHAYDLLNPGGKLVAIMAANKEGERRKVKEFNDFMSARLAEITENPEGSFLSSFRPTAVNTITVVIEKPFTMEKKYDNIKECLLSDGDNENDFIIEGTKIFNLEGGHLETWKVAGFYNDGLHLVHVPQSILSNHKDMKKLSFDEFKRIFSSNIISIEGVSSGDIKTINLCIKSIKKCMEVVDNSLYAKKIETILRENEEEIRRANEFQAREKSMLIETSQGIIDLRWDLFSDKHKNLIEKLTREDHVLLAQAHRHQAALSDSAEIKGYHSGAVNRHEKIAAEKDEIADLTTPSEPSINTQEVKEAIQFIKDILPDLKKKEKAEANEALGWLNDLLKEAKSEKKKMAKGGLVNDYDEWRKRERKEEIESLLEGWAIEQYPDNEYNLDNDSESVWVEILDVDSSEIENLESDYNSFAAPFEKFADENNLYPASILSSDNSITFSVELPNKKTRSEGGPVIDEDEYDNEYTKERIEDFLKNLAEKHGGTWNYSHDQDEDNISLNFSFPSPENQKSFADELSTFQNGTLKLEDGGRVTCPIKKQLI